MGKFKKGQTAWNKGMRGFNQGHSNYNRELKGCFLSGDKHPDNKGEKHPMWKGGITCDSIGYIRIYSPNHPKKDLRNCVGEHILVMEKHLGRFLEKNEVVHHINGIRSDNRIENLQIFKNNAEHIKKAHNKSGIDWKNKKEVNKYMREWNRKNPESKKLSNKKYREGRKKND